MTNNLVDGTLTESFGNLEHLRNLYFSFYLGKDFSLIKRKTGAYKITICAASYHNQ